MGNTPSQQQFDLSRRRILVEGIVQGVGFRPFIYQLANRLGVSGWVRNDSAGVTIEAEGAPAALENFAAAIDAEKPPLAQISGFRSEPLAPTGATGFRIVPSQEADEVRVQVSPDSFVCNDCLRELFDPTDRRYRYPFINCTNCGPRYTIITGIPYDRPLTTMARFAMCPDCLAEYRDPASRRFHAQPNACPICGPQLTLLTAEGTPSADDPLVETIAALHAGQVVAVKGLGGYHLAVDAANAAAVRCLRQRKRRDEKPFALMVADLTAAQQIVHCSELEARLLASPERPIVLLRKRPGHDLAAEVAPDNRYFGVMLPGTPLHHLLLAGDFRALVMTSANLSDEPIVYQDEDARQRLAGIADLFLLHDRDIHIRADDSIARVMAGEPLLLRRSRGYVPRMVRLPRAQRPTLAVGAELKSTVCLTRNDQAFLSQHIGDLKDLDVYAAFTAAIDHLKEILEIVPERIVWDLHPDYQSTRYALEESGLPGLAVQHHHAHLAACLVEHGRQAPAIGLILDGIGYGTDGHVWGGEFLVGDLRQFERVGHFRYQPMPGGDLATRQPWRMALSYLLDAYDGDLPEVAFLQAIPDDERWLVAQATRQRLNAPLTSSCGRLFDAVAAILGLHLTVSFEGQAAMGLEMIADTRQTDPYPYRLEWADDQLLFDPLPIVPALVEAKAAGVPKALIAGRFHATLAAMLAQVCQELRARTGLHTVALSGGVFQNCLLTEMLRARLVDLGFEPLVHSLVPPNDAGLALGQVAIAGQVPAADLLDAGSA